MRIGKIIFACVALIALCGCATKTKVEYVDREVVKYQIKVQHDTLIQNTHDSIYYSVMQKGDTIFATKYVEKTKYKDRSVFKCDTLYKDSLVVTQVKETVKEKRYVPNWCYFTLAIVIVVFIYSLYRRLR